MAESDGWYILEGLKATTKNGRASSLKKDKYTSDKEQNWFELAADSATQESRQSPSQTDSSSSQQDGRRRNVSFEPTTQTIMTFHEGPGPGPSIARLHLQESVDGEMSESIHSSSLNSLKTSHSISSHVSTDLNDNNSFLHEAQLGTELSATGEDFSGASNNNALEWVNLTAHSHIQDVSRSEPIGFARAEAGRLLQPANASANSRQSDQSSTHYSIVSSTDSKQVSRSHSITNSFTKYVSSAETRSNTPIRFAGSETIMETVGDVTNADYRRDVSRDTSYSASIGNKPAVYKRTILNIDKRKKTPQLPEEQDQNFSSMGSSLTMPSYKEVSPKAHPSYYETPVTKLLGPAYKKTQQFLHELQAEKFKYASSDNQDASKHDSNVSSTSKYSFNESKDESCQAGKSRLHYSTIELSDIEDLPYTESLTDQGMNRDYLVEQDLASASSLEEENETRRTTFKNHFVENQRESQSEGELLLSEISEPVSSIKRSRPSSKSSVDSSKGTSSTYKSAPQNVSLQTSTTSSSARTTLEPIQEEVKKNDSPQKKNKFRIVSKIPVYSLMSPKKASAFSPETSTYKSFKSGKVSFSSTPYDQNLNESDVIQSNGIYDIRKSTSPGSTNRKRIYAGKEPLDKPSQTHDPSDIYVSENSKLADSLISTTTDQVDNDSNPLPVNTAECSNFDDKHTTEISYKLSHDEESSKVTPRQEDLRRVTNTTITANAPVDVSTGYSSDDDTDVPIASSHTIVPESVSSDEFKVNNSVDENRAQQYVGSTSSVSNQASDKVSVQGKPVGSSLGSNAMASSSPSSSPFDVTKKSLDLLWRDIDESMKSVPQNSSPILKKLALLSEIIKKQKKKRLSQMSNSLSSTDNFSSSLQEKKTSPKHVDNTPYTTSRLRESPVRIPSSHRKPWGKDVNEKPDITPLALNTSSSSSLSQKSASVGTKSHSTRKTHSSDGGIPNTYRVKTTRQESSPEIFTTYRVIDGSQPVVRTEISAEQRPCPYCNKRSIGTNCPTPCPSDVENKISFKLLNTWTQTTSNTPETSSYLSGPAKAVCVESSVSSWIECQHNISRPHAVVRVPTNARVSSRNKHNAKISSNVLKEASTCVEDPNRMVPNAEQQDERDGVTYTAWFHTVRSDNSEIYPITKDEGENTLSERYLLYRRQRIERREGESDSHNVPDILTLQEAFQLNKQPFIHRLKQRVQDVKDARLNEKYSSRPRNPQYHMNGSVFPKKEVKLAQQQLHLKKKERRVRVLIEKDSPRELHRQEERRLALLRKNRLRMKQYDVKIRQSFLRRRPCRQQPMCFYIERH